MEAFTQATNSCHVVLHDAAQYTLIGLVLIWSCSVARHCATQKTLCVHIEAGLPGGIYSNQKSKCGYILVGLAMEDVCKVNDRLVYLFYTDIWYILWPFGTFSDSLVYFSGFDMF
jgi:hypothetical protein